MDAVKQEVITKPDNISTNSSKSTSIIMNYIVIPLRAGIFGFLIYFAVIAFTKFIAYSLGISDDFTLGNYDLLLSSVGFLYSFLYHLIKNFTPK